jgi:hypothetical protein
MISGYVLLYVALAGAPAQLGTYETEAACTAAIRAIVSQKMAPSAPNNPGIKRAIDTVMQYQREYVCQPQK